MKEGITIIMSIFTNDANNASFTESEAADFLLDAALQYEQRGWSVIPLAARAKKPDLRKWQPHQNQRAEDKTIREWWGANPQRNIGIVTGEISGLVVLDVDGDEGRASLRDLTLPATPTVQTGRGLHYYFAHPGFHVANAVGFLPGLDIRADGGYVVAPPSVHPSGTRYEWAPNLSPVEVDLAPCPTWMLDKLMPKAEVQARPVEEWRSLVAQGARQGQRNDSLASLAGHLLHKYVDPLVVLELLLCWNRTRNRPPLSDVEVAQTLDSIAGRERLRRKGGVQHV